MSVSFDCLSPLSLRETFIRDTANLAYQAMLVEVYTTPKPGLVDLNNTGSHSDMTVATFEYSAKAIQPWLEVFVRTGIETASKPIRELLPSLRPAGKQCERAMFLATAGVNTHKGMLFSLSLVCAVTGRLWQQGRILSLTTICDAVAAATDGIVARELSQNVTPKTAGERFFHQHGLTGVRGEVASGFQTVRDYAFPVYLKALDESCTHNTALLEVMLSLLAHNQDTNLVSRGGMDGLAYVQSQAKTIMHHTAFLSPAREQALEVLDKTLIERHLSPGGSADLLAITWFLHQLTQ